MHYMPPRSWRQSLGLGFALEDMDEEDIYHILYEYHIQDIVRINVVVGRMPAAPGTGCWLRLLPHEIVHLCSCRDDSAVLYLEPHLLLPWSM